jgi:hypothetical protein
MSETAKNAWPPETRALFDEIYGKAVDVSIVRLLANPEEFSGKAVRLWGVFHVDRETMALFLSRESYEYGVSQNAVPISTTYTRIEDLPRLNGHYVWIVGVFDAKEGGPIGFTATGNGHLHDVLPIVPAQVRLKLREAAPPREFDGEVFE